MNLDVFPGKLLANPGEAGLLDKLHGPFDLRRLHFILEKGVHAKGIHPHVADRERGAGARIWAQPAGDQVANAPHLW